MKINAVEGVTEWESLRIVRTRGTLKVRNKKFGKVDDKPEEELVKFSDCAVDACLAQKQIKAITFALTKFGLLLYGLHID